MVGEGFILSWADVKAGVKLYPGLASALADLLEEDINEVEDKVREKAKAGDTQAVRLVLQAERPGKYGNKVRVDVHQHHELTAGDEQLVENIKGQFVAPYRPKQVPQSFEDVVDGEVVS